MTALYKFNTTLPLILLLLATVSTSLPLINSPNATPKHVKNLTDTDLKDSTNIVPSSSNTDLKDSTPSKISMQTTIDPADIAENLPTDSTTTQAIETTTESQSNSSIDLRNYQTVSDMVTQGCLKWTQKCYQFVQCCQAKCKEEGYGYKGNYCATFFNANSTNTNCQCESPTTTAKPGEKLAEKSENHLNNDPLSWILIVCLILGISILIVYYVIQCCIRDSEKDQINNNPACTTTSCGGCNCTGCDCCGDCGCTGCDCGGCDAGCTGCDCGGC